MSDKSISQYHYMVGPVGFIYKRGEGLVSQRDDGRGYRCVTVLCKDGQRRTLKVHRIVWEWFNGDIPQGIHVDHIDGDKTNNHIDNLRLLSASENSARCDRSNNKKRTRITSGHKTTIRKLTAQGWPTKRIADHLEIGCTTVRRYKK
jgi:hypothetical protein